MQASLNDQRCPFCGGERLRRFRVPAHDLPSATVSIVECRRCDAGWQWPLQRSERESAGVFHEAYAEQTEGSYFEASRRAAVAACQREFLAQRLPRPGRLLDVGCGDGSFAREMAAAGWDVLGLDPALPAPIDEARPPGRVRLTNQPLDTLPADAPFDLVTLWDVVEHVERPDRLIADAARLLAPGGRLVVETGNYQSAGRILDDRWWNYQVDHRWYLAPPQLQAMLAEAGLGRVELADGVLRPWWTGRAGVPPPSRRALLRSVLRRPWQAVDRWQRHRRLVRGAPALQAWGGLEIMTMVAQR